MTFPTKPGTTFKFTVRTADEAARLIRAQLGSSGRVLSVRNVGSSGFLGFMASPRLEVVAQIVAPEPATPPAGETPPATPAAPPAPRSTPARRESTVGARARADALPPAPGSLVELLRRSGFSEKLLLRLRASPAWAELEALPLHRALVGTGRHLRTLASQRPESAPLHRAAFLGTPGVGRTTALCKWLSSEVFRRARLGHVVTAEFERPNPPGPLPVFCEALGVPLAHFPASTQPATAGGFVYFDLPGISLRNRVENIPLAEFLDREEIAQRVLVLNAAYDHAALRAGYAAGRDLGATHVVFTHLDEVTQWGRLWDYLLDGELQPLFLATGPSLSGDLEEDPLEAVARRTLPAEAAAQETSSGASEETAAGLVAAA
jgi:flagellar biosynthesis protein FlhF